MSSSKDSFLFRHAAHHTAKAGKPEVWQHFFRAVESHQHLDRQAGHFGNFELTSDDLETYCLPAIVKLQDWDRFVHYSLIAANLRGLAEALAGEDVLEPLTRHGRLDLAESLAGSLSDPLRRARARAVIAGALDRKQVAFDRLFESLLEDLDAAPKPDDGEAAESWCRTLETAAERLAPDLQEHWAPWICCLGAWPDLADRARRAVANGLIANGDLEDPLLWETIGAVGDAGYLLDTLPRRLAAQKPGEPWRLLEPLHGLKPHGEWLSWPACAAIAGRLAAGEATALWRQVAEAWEPAPWSLELVAAGRELWAKLAPEDFDQLAGGIGDVTVQAALRVVRLEQLPGNDAEGGAAAALAAVDRVPFPPQRLHWSLRYLAARPRDAELERGVVAVGAHLARRRYAVPASELCRFLDLVAKVFPQRLRLEVQNVLWAPESRAETLRTLALEAQATELLEELLERVERYASTVASNEAAGFELRLEVLVTVTRRLCARRENLTALDQAVERLLPEEEDTLRAAVAEEMVGVGRGDLAREASRLIRGRLRRRTRLATAAGPELEKLLAPGALYEAVADVDVVADECRALGALLEAPLDPDDLARRRLEEIRGKGRVIQALVDLAWHAFVFQDLHLSRRRQDRPAALIPLRRALGVVESDAWLVALTPELAALGSRLGGTQALAELKEASERILAQSSVPWRLREEALERLLARLLGSSAEGEEKPSVDRCRVAAAFIDWLADLPRTLGDKPEAKELRRHWHRVFPRIVAGFERLPEAATAYLQHPWRTRLGLAPPAGGRAPRKASTSELRGKLRPRWADARLDRFRGAWGDLMPAQEKILELCFAPREERLRRAAEAEADVKADPDVLHALIYLLAAGAPQQVPALVKRLPPAERDRLVLRWIRNGWAPEQNGELLAILDPERVRLGKVWHGLHDDPEDEDAWITAIREMISGSELDPSDPRTVELQRRLWRLDRQRHLPELATATVGALDSGGRKGGERGLRLFLNALVAPRFGHKGSDPQRERLESVAAAARRARSLAGEPDVQDDDDQDPPPASERPAGGLRRWPRTWSNRPARLLTRSQRWSDPGSIALLLGMALLVPITILDGALCLSSEPGGDSSLTWSPPASSAAAALAMVWLGNTWALGTSLSLQTPRELGIRTAVRGLRTLLVGLPLFGLWILPLWRRLTERRTRWLLRARDHPEPGSLAAPGGSARRRSSPFRRLTRAVQWTGRTWGFVGIYLVNFAVVVMAISALAERVAVDDRWLVSAAVLCGVLHAGAGAGMAYFSLGYIRDEKIADWRAAAMASMPVFWLIPWPGLPLLGMMLLVLIPMPRKPLSAEAFAAVGGVGRFPRWSSFLKGTDAQRGGSWWRSLLAAGDSGPARESERELRSLVAYRTKAVTLFFEAAALAWGIQWLETRAGWLSAETVLMLAASLSLCLGTVGLLAMAVRFVRRLMKPENKLPFIDHDLHVDFAAGTQLAFCAGLLFGLGLYQREPALVFGTAILVGLAGAVIHIGPVLLAIFLPVPEESPQQGRARTLWTLAFVSIAMTAVAVPKGAESPSAATFAPFVSLLWIGPLFGTIIGAGSLEWLLHPFRPKLAFSRQTPPRLRRPLAAIAWPAILPLGGLAIPIWIYLREQLWRELEEGWLQQQPPGPTLRV